MALFVKGWRCETETRIGYYVAARRYETSLRVLKNISQHETISRRPNYFTLIVFNCERRNLWCIHSNGDLFTCEDNIMFSRESSRGISLVFI